MKLLLSSVCFIVSFISAQTNVQFNLTIYPSFTPDNITALRPVQRTVATEHPNLSVIKYGKVDPVKAGEWASSYYGNGCRIC